MKVCLSLLLLLLLLLILPGVVDGGNLIRNPGFESGSESWVGSGGGFEGIDPNVAYSGNCSLKCTSEDINSIRGAQQILTFDPPLEGEYLRVSGWSCAKNAKVEWWKNGKDYNVYLDILYDDDTWLYGVRANFWPGIHSWEYAEKVFRVEKPVKQINVHLFLRRGTGAVWFDEIAVEEVSLDKTGGDRGYAVWAEDSMTRVFPGSCNVLAAGEMPVEPRVAVTLAGGEYESFQILLRSPARLSVDVEMTDLVSADGARIDAKNIEWYQVGYLKFDRFNNDYHPDTLDRVAGWWPEMLLPVSKINLLADFTQSIWFTVYAPPGTKPGKYSGSIVLNPEGKDSATIGVNVEVYDFSLAPGAGHFKNTFALHEGYMEKVYGKPLERNLRLKYGEFLLRHRLNPDDITRTDPPGIKDLVVYQGLGMNCFNVLNLVEDRGSSPWRPVSPVRWYTEGHKRELVAELDPYIEALRAEEGLVEKAYFYGFDERGIGEYGDIIKEWFGMIKNRWGISTLTTAQLATDLSLAKEMSRLNIDGACSIIHDERWFDWKRCKFKTGEAVRAADPKLEVWGYTCISSAYPAANIDADNWPIEGRIMGWQFFHEKLDGYLYWGLNKDWGVGGKDIINPDMEGPLIDWDIEVPFKEYAGVHGDGLMLYPGGDGPIGSIRLENIRDGLEDYEYLWMLSERVKDIDAVREKCYPVITAQDFEHFSRNPETVYLQREAIARQLEGK